MSEEKTEPMIFLTVEEAASFLKVSKITVYKLCEKGDIPAVKIGSSWRIRKDLLMKKVNAQFDEPSPTDSLE